MGRATRAVGSSAGESGHAAARAAVAQSHRLDPDGTITEVISRVDVSNGIAWNAVGDSAWYIDTATGSDRHVQRRSGWGPRRAPALRRGAFGLRTWTGCASTPRVVSGSHSGTAPPCIATTQTGRSIRVIPVPVGRPTACAFGGGPRQAVHQHVKARGRRRRSRSSVRLADPGITRFPGSPIRRLRSRTRQPEHRGAQGSVPRRSRWLRCCRRAPQWLSPAGRAGRHLRW